MTRNAPERMHEWARAIAEREAGDSVTMPSHRAISSMRLGLELLVGVNGADAMVYRAIFLARRELGLVAVAHNGERGSRENLSGLDGATGALFTETVMAYLLWLTVEFIGEPLTISFVRQTWPDVCIPSPDNDKPESEA